MMKAVYVRNIYKRPIPFLVAMFVVIFQITFSSSHASQIVNQPIVIPVLVDESKTAHDLPKSNKDILRSDRPLVAASSDSKRKLWIGRYDGLYVWDSEEEKLTKVVNDEVIDGLWIEGDWVFFNSRVSPKLEDVDIAQFKMPNMPWQDEVIFNQRDQRAYNGELSVINIKTFKRHKLIEDVPYDYSHRHDAHQIEAGIEKIWITNEQGTWYWKPSGALTSVGKDIQFIGVLDNNEYVLNISEHPVVKICKWINNSSDCDSLDISFENLIAITTSQNNAFLLTKNSQVFSLSSRGISLLIDLEQNKVNEDDDLRFFSATNEYLWIKQGERLIRFSSKGDMDIEVEGSLPEIGRNALAYSDNGKYYLIRDNKNSPEEIMSFQIGQQKFFFTESATWLLTENGLFNYSPSGTVDKLPWKPRRLRDIGEVGNGVWFSDPRSLYYLASDRNVAVKFSSIGRLGYVDQSITKFLEWVGIHDAYPSGLYKVEVSYNKVGNDSKLIKPKNPRIIFWEGEWSQDESPSPSTQKSVNLSISSGNSLIGATTYNYYLEDDWGNQREGRIHIKSVARVETIAGITYAVILLSSILIIYLAPYSTLANDFVMNKNLRRWASLFCMPILLSAPLARRHLLKRYRKVISVNTNEAALSYVVPPEFPVADDLLEGIATDRTWFVFGASGIGKTQYLLYVCNKCANDSSCRFLPVYIPLRRYETAKPEDVLKGELLKSGQFKDDDLLSEILRRDHLIFLIDGLNEASSGTHRLWASFVQVHSENHAFVLTSQVKEERFDFTKVTVKVPPLGTPQIKHIATKCLGDSSEEFLAELSRGGIALANNPQNLMVLIRAFEADLSLPRTQYELYEYLIAPVFKKWEEEGNETYISALRQIATEGMASGSASVDKLSSSAVSDLLDQRLVVHRGKRREIVHDKVLYYVVANYLLEEGVNLQALDALGSNWKNVMELVGEKCSQDDAKNYAFQIMHSGLVGSVERAEEFVENFIRLHGEVCVANWLNEFDQEAGRIRRSNVKS